MTNNSTNNISGTSANKQKNQFSGILVTLLKREQIPIHTDDENFDYTIFGHYDGLEINYVNSWSGFFPRNVEKSQGEISLDDNILDLYTLRACEPQKKNKLINKGFVYDIQEKEKDKQWQIEHPLVACSLIHLSKEAVKNYSVQDIINNIATKISAGKSKSEIRELNCGIYFSIGYSDIIILFRVNDFKRVDEAIRRLGNSISSKENLISDSYTITGFKNKTFQNIDEIKAVLKAKNNIESKKFAVSFALRNNIDVGEFAAYIKDRVKCLCERLDIEFEPGVTVNTDNNQIKAFGNAFSVFGNTDVIIELNLPIYAYMALYMADNTSEKNHFPFSIKHNLHNIATIQSVAMIPMPIENLPEDFNDIKRRLATDKYKSYSDEFKKYIDKFSKFTLNHGISYRNVVAIKQLVKAFDNLVLTDHGFEIKSIIGNAFKAFLRI